MTWLTVKAIKYRNGSPGWRGDLPFWRGCVKNGLIGPGEEGGGEPRHGDGVSDRLTFWFTDAASIFHPQQWKQLPKSSAASAHLC